MRKKLLTIVSALCATSFAFGVITTLATADTTVDIFEDAYIKGQTFVVPETTKVAGRTVSVEDATIYAPDGKIYTDSAIVLRQMGIYTVEYSIVDGDDVSKYTETFKSLSETYSIKGNGGYEYKANAKTPYTYGINVDLKDGGVFEYNKIIDLNDLAPTDDLVSLYVVPERIGIPDFYVLTITLTDIYDSTNKVMISGQNVADGYYNGVWEYEYAKYTCYIKAGSTSQPMSGLQGGEGGQLHVNNTYGYSSLCSFSGLGAGGTPMDKDRFTVSFDYAERKVLKDGKLVIDLDDSRYFSELWQGFTTGEVYLSISLNQAGSFVITDIAEEKLTSDVTFFENGSPVIEIDYQGYEEVPNGIAGRVYTLFDATAKDSYSGVLNVQKNVYYDYEGSKEAIEVSNNTFLPKKAGIYTIEYLATDWCGNTAVERCDVAIKAVANPITVAIDTTTQVVSGTTGQKLPIATIDASGGHGDLTVDVSVFDSKGNAVPLEKGYFIPFSAGKYKVVYTVSDYINQIKTLEYFVDVVLSEKPVFVDDVTIPKYFMNGKKYQLPVLEGYVFTTNSTSKETAEIWVKDGNAERKLDSNIYEPSIKENGSLVEIVYKLGNTKKTYSATGYITTNSLGGMDLTTYFIHSSNVTAQSTSQNLSYTTTKQGEKLSFINPLLANGFSLCFKLTGGAKAITFTLKDYENATQTVTAKLASTGSTSWNLLVNGTDSYTVDSSYFAKDKDTYIMFDNISNKLGLSNGKNVAWYYLDSENANYFMSGKVYLDIEFTEIGSSTSLYLSNLNNQNLKTLAVDLLRPSVSVFSNAIGIKYSIGDKVSTSRAVGLDVLDPYTITTMTVKHLDGEIVTDINGVKLENVAADVSYVFELKKYGNYTISYSVIDSSNRAGGYEYVVNATDDIKPTLQLEYRLVKTAAINDVVFVPKAFGQDNASQKVTIGYYIITPDGVLHYMNRELYDSFKINAVGTYIVRYTATDEKGNMLVQDFKIIVE